MVKTPRPMDVVGTWLEALAETDPEDGDLTDDLYFDLIGGEEDEDEDEDPPEVHDPNMQSLPDHDIPTYGTLRD
jgi:hypothetical protein